MPMAGTQENAGAGENNWWVCWSLPDAHLPKLLLQHDESPYQDDFHKYLLREAAEDHVQWTLHPNGSTLAIAVGQRLVLLNLRSPDSPNTLHFHNATEAPESITALCWLSSLSSTDSCLLLGTSTGFFQIHAFDGRLLHRQEIHHTAICSITIRSSGCSLQPLDATEDVMVGMSDAVARIVTWETWAVVRWHLGASSAASKGGWGWGGGASTTAPQDLSMTKWSLGKGALNTSIGPRTCTFCLGPQLPDLYPYLKNPQLLYEDPLSSTAAEGLQLFTGGSNPPIASFQLLEGSQHGIATLVGALAVNSASALLGKARGLVRPSGTKKAPKEGADNKGGGKKREKIPGLPASQTDSIWDEKRTVDRVALSPCCRWAACCDSLGRVLLVDTRDTIILRLFKGYRDAQAAWLVVPDSQQQDKHNNSSRADQRLYLLLYAPFKGVVEVWLPFQGKRLVAIPSMPRYGLLLQQPIQPGKSYDTNTSTSSGIALHLGGLERRFSGNTCWMLDLEQLKATDITPQILNIVGGSSV